MNKFYTISIIKSWNVKFVKSNDQHLVHIPPHALLPSQTSMGLLLQWIHTCKFCEWWICLHVIFELEILLSPLQFENPNNPHTQVLDQNKVKELEFHFWASSKWVFVAHGNEPTKNSTTGSLTGGFWAAIGSAQNNLHGWFNSSQVLHQWAAWLLDCRGRNRLCPE